jgi:molecular chaperone DnaJ
LFVVVHVAGHPLFGRKGRNLTLTVPITYPEATLGGAITVPSLTEPVTLKIPAGTRQGRTFRVKGRGITTASSTGDLLVTVDVVVPAQLTEDQRKAVEALAKTLDASPRHHLGV